MLTDTRSDLEIVLVNNRSNVHYPFMFTSVVNSC